jgi:hypothetical protein
LSVAVCAVTTTKRRRFLWAAWWTEPPTESPFRSPDAYAGGARTHDEAFAAAEKAAGRTLSEIPSRWARAWMRVLEGRPAWTTRNGPEAGPVRAAKPEGVGSIWQTLGVSPTASATELKRAYHKQALATHPDRGGDPGAFRDVQRAFVEAQRRLARRGPRPRARR